MPNEVIVFRTDFSVTVYTFENDSLQCVQSANSIDQCEWDSKTNYDVIIPGEWVSQQQVTLPKANKKSQLATLPYSIEDNCAESIESVFIALGQHIDDHTYLAAIISRDLMQRILFELKPIATQVERIIPDYFSLPTTQAGVTIHLNDHRVVIRTDHYHGFTCDIKEAVPLFTVHETHGHATIYHDASTPDTLKTVSSLFNEVDCRSISTTSTAAQSDCIANAPINLAQQEFQCKKTSLAFNRYWKAAIITACVWLIAFFSTQSVLLWHLQNQTKQLQQQIHTLAQPYLSTTGSPQAIKNQLLTELRHEQQLASHFQFIHLLDVIATVMPRFTSIQLQHIDFTHNQLQLKLSANHSQTIDHLTTSLQRHGIHVIKNQVHVNHQQTQATIEVTQYG